VFFFYTYNPHPDFDAETTQLVTASRVVIESLDLRVSDGVDLGERAIDSEIERRIIAADSLVAIVTPKRTAPAIPLFHPTWMTSTSSPRARQNRLSGYSTRPSPSRAWVSMRSTSRIRPVARWIPSSS
jgi:hypothetical protein